MFFILKRHVKFSFQFKKVNYYLTKIRFETKIVYFELA